MFLTSLDPDAFTPELPPVALSRKKEVEARSKGFGGGRAWLGSQEGHQVSYVEAQNSVFIPVIGLIIPLLYNLLEK